ncbi:MAG: ABC transporter ATP-binding protein [Proteobacteria bacterium]|nr:ABC transporter ATP-binding protein [Pseudomonadota bacterium]
MSNSLIQLQDIALRYPLLGIHNRSLKQILLPRFGRNAAQVPEKINFIDALKGISFELTRGDRLGLIGRNGAGKSTLLKLLAGIYSPSQGNICVRGNVSPLLGISVGMNPQATGYENIKFRCLLHGFDRFKIEKIYREVEEFTELGRFLAMPVKTYSSGMNVRLSFAIATAITPDILVVDEVVGVGDVQFIEKAKARLTDLIESSNILVLASHSDEIVKKFCNKLLWLERGSIVKFSDKNLDATLEEYKQSCAGQASQFL